MHRRRVLNLLGLAVTAWGTRAGRSAWRRSVESERLRFDVAGVRFHDVDAFALPPGAAVELRRGRFGHETCYAVCDGRGRRLGFVPRRLVPVVERGQFRRAVLSGVRPHAVPWKQLEVTVERDEGPRTGPRRVRSA